VIMRRALVVGIDHYPQAALAGCVNDARTMAALLARNADGSPNFSVRELTSDSTRITRAVLKRAVSELFEHDEADVALLYFSGHGTENNLDGYLVTVDAAAYDEGLSLTDVLTLANNSKAREVVLILDSCMSGHLGQPPVTGATQLHLREGVSILTASRAGQVSVESRGRGLFTELVAGALEGGAADVLGLVTAASIYAYVEQALGPWEQRPLFKAHLSKLVTLRVAQPAVSPDFLRALGTLFPSVDHQYLLDRSYEPTEKPDHPEHEGIFLNLQKCRAAKLVEPVGEEHMYYAALNNKACQLTPLGRLYWRLVRDGRL
jgi:uncharacterized caspase-like protein